MIPLTNEQQKLELRKIFIPLTAAEIIWDYVDRVLRYCADHRISETMKLSRAVKKTARKLRRLYTQKFRLAAPRVSPGGVLRF